MGCCGGKNGCKKNETTSEQLNFSSPTIISSLQGVAPELVAKLGEIAAAGINAGKIFRDVCFKNTTLEKLAKQITDLAVENAYMRSVFNLMSPIDTNVSDSLFTLNFGPGHVYSLRIPVTNRNSRIEIAKQLRIAAEQLEQETKKPDTDSETPQMVFPFAN